MRMANFKIEISFGCGPAVSQCSAGENGNATATLQEQFDRL